MRSIDYELAVEAQACQQAQELARLQPPALELARRQQLESERLQPAIERAQLMENARLQHELDRLRPILEQAEQLRLYYDLVIRPEIELAHRMQREYGLMMRPMFDVAWWQQREFMSAKLVPRKKKERNHRRYFITVHVFVEAV